MADPDVERLFRENFAVIRAKCTRILGATEEAADVAQETFARLCEAGPGQQDAAARVAWIYRTSTRIAVDRLRRRRLAIETPDDGADASARAAAADDVVGARRLLAAIAAVSPRSELEVAVLCRIDGLTQPEAAEVCGVSERTVRRLLERFDARAQRLDGRVA